MHGAELADAEVLFIPSPTTPSPPRLALEYPQNVLPENIPVCHRAFELTAVKCSNSGGKELDMQYPEDLNKLNVIHITGTKGKGSTSAFCDSLLHQSMPRWSIGLFTSPHLVAVRERIRINGQPISEEAFAKYFFDVWDKLEANDARANPDTPPKPMYFRFLTLVAFHAFIDLKVDATVLEVGVGGKYDCTNLVPKPVVAGVTSLGIDHIFVLGKTLSEIAWQKGGIFKEGAPAFTVNQPEEGLTMLRQRAEELKASKFVVVPPAPEVADIKLGLAGVHQIQNANLAVHIVREFLESRGVPLPNDGSLSPAFIEGLEKARWPGRCQTVQDPKYETTTWFIDGAHTTESLDCCIQWFVSPGVGIGFSSPPTRILVFNCTSGRSGDAFLGGILAKAAAQLKLHNQNDTDATHLFDHVIFCTNVTYADGGFKGDLTSHAISNDDLVQLKTQRMLEAAWTSLVPEFPKSNIHVLPSIEHAVNTIRQVDRESDTKQTQVLVAGSLHLVGGVIEVAGLSEVAL
ncbi:hypothetical protein CCMSSC00406_0002909 [Pleurotus cornucopiae]|uniref:Uncharacterized protein n=1 Tax=Pleurotus cornucopiae TaxID=5321 RepID=A0ACB7IXV2_PLECO|nr:hypothetical protein CCMSSC00406_0002909 [Pleurotus cornucopiae]